MTNKHQSQAVTPWKYNPSGWPQRLPVFVLGLIATAISGYMALYQVRLIDSVWDPVFGESSQKVLDSGVSQTMEVWWRIPDAALGAIAYLGDAVFGIAGSTRRWQYRPWLVILFGIDVIPLGVVSIILVILQGTVVGYWCFLCLVTAAISVALIYLAYDEVWSSLVYLYRVYQRSKSKEALWKAFWGQATDTGRIIGKEMTGGNDVA